MPGANTDLLEPLRQTLGWAGYGVLALVMLALLEHLFSLARLLLSHTGEIRRLVTVLIVSSLEVVFTVGLSISALYRGRAVIYVLASQFFLFSLFVLLPRLWHSPECGSKYLPLRTFSGARLGVVVLTGLLVWATIHYSTGIPGLWSDVLRLGLIVGSGSVFLVCTLIQLLLIRSIHNWVKVRFS